MNISNVILLLTCCFSGISIIISALSLLMTRKIEKDKAYINTITSSREKWADDLQCNGAKYLSIVESIFNTKENLMQKYEELLKYQYLISISVFEWEDDKQILSCMQEMQAIIFNCLILKKSKPQMDRVCKLKNQIFFIIKQKYKKEWEKKKYEVGEKW